MITPQKRPTIDLPDEIEAKPLVFTSRRRAEALPPPSPPQRSKGFDPSLLAYVVGVTGAGCGAALVAFVFVVLQ